MTTYIYIFVLCNNIDGYATINIYLFILLFLLVAWELKEIVLRRKRYNKK